VDGAPRWKGTTFVVEEVPTVVCTMTSLALMVVPLTVPRTRTLSLFCTALAEVDAVPFLYAVDAALLMVTF
jgi:hypothetical protein